MPRPLARQTDTPAACGCGMRGAAARSARKRVVTPWQPSVPSDGRCKGRQPEARHSTAACSARFVRPGGSGGGRHCSSPGCGTDSGAAGIPSSAKATPYQGRPACSGTRAVCGASSFRPSSAGQQRARTGSRQAHLLYVMMPQLPKVLATASAAREDRRVLPGRLAACRSTSGPLSVAIQEVGRPTVVDCDVAALASMAASLDGFHLSFSAFACSDQHLQQLWGSRRGLQATSLAPAGFVACSHTCPSDRPSHLPQFIDPTALGER